MKVIREPLNTAVCDRCHAHLEFDKEDVMTTVVLGYHEGIKNPRLCIECPWCKNIIWVWDADK